MNFIEMNFTELEKQVIRLAHKSSKNNGHNFGCTEDVVEGMPDLSTQQMEEVLSSLENKGVFDTPPQNEATQFVLAEVYRTESTDDLKTQRVPTPEELAKYAADPSKCIFCNSNRLKKGRPVVSKEEPEAYQDVSCKACGESWSNTYRLNEVDVWPKGFDWVWRG